MITTKPTAGPTEARVILTYADLEELRRREEQRQQGKAPWRIPPESAPTDRDGPLARINLNTTGTRP